MKWQQVTVFTTSAFADTVSYILIEKGSEGALVKDATEIANVIKNHNWDYIDETLEKTQETEEAIVSGFFDISFNANEITETLNEWKSFSETETGSLEVLTTVVDSLDWENEWRKYYRPIEIGHIAIVPKWYKYDNKKKLTEVRIEPGMAFGTGSHETTSMCIRLIQECKIAGKKVADVGCGSGILGLAAIQSGASSCAFVDIDAQAVKATKDNIALNSICADKTDVHLGNLLDFNSGVFDVVLANITADILILLKEDLKRSLKIGGQLIISGLIHSRADEVRKIYEQDYTVIKNERDGEWQAFLMIKK